VAKGICYALDKPLIAVGTLDAMAVHAAKNLSAFYRGNSPDGVILCPMIDARRMEVYTSVYNLEGTRLEPVSAKIVEENTYSEILRQNTVLFFGNGAQKCKSKITQPNALFPNLVKASARFMISLSEDIYNNKEFEDVAYFEPFYLKDFIATVPKNKIIK
jgi:tRNA threonylcarbamoyladenosine biosynthesis protein TsaB